MSNNISDYRYSYDKNNEIYQNKKNIKILSKNFSGQIYKDYKYIVTTLGLYLHPKLFINDNIISIRGWTLDLGTAYALCIAIRQYKPLIKSNYLQIKFWHTNLNDDVIDLMYDLLVTQQKISKYNGNNYIISLSIQFNTTMVHNWYKLISIFPSLQSLSLQSCNINDDDIIKLFNILSSSNLLSLNLWQNNLTNKCLVSLTTYLNSKNCILLCLSLANNVDITNINLLLNSFKSDYIINDKDELKLLRKQNISITLLKSISYKDANQSLKILDLSGLKHIDYQQILNFSLIPISLQPDDNDDKKKKKNY